MFLGFDKPYRCIHSFLHSAATWNQCVPLNKTCKNVLGLHLSKTLSFLVSHKDQQKAATPASNNKFNLFHTAYTNSQKGLPWYAVRESQTPYARHARETQHIYTQKINVEQSQNYCRCSIICFLTNFFQLDYLCLVLSLFLRN